MSPRVDNLLALASLDWGHGYWYPARVREQAVSLTRKLNFKGAPENQGMLLVDSAQTVDPVTGSFSIPVPLDAIQTLSVYAREVVRMYYQAPDHKSFRTMSEEGSGLVRDLVLKRLIESESETSSGRAHHDSAIKSANYEFKLLGEQDIGPYHCLVAEAVPKRKDKYLFAGRVWIDAEDYAIVRIAGRPGRDACPRAALRKEDPDHPSRPVCGE